MSRIDQYRLLNATLFYKIHFKHLRRPSARPDSSCKQIALMKAIVENASDDGKTSRRIEWPVVCQRVPETTGPPRGCADHLGRDFVPMEAGRGAAIIEGLCLSRRE